MVEAEIFPGTVRNKGEEDRKRHDFLNNTGVQFGSKAQGRLGEFWNGLSETPLLLPTESPDQALLQSLVSQHYEVRAHDFLAKTPVRIIFDPEDALKASSNQERSIDLGWFEEIEKLILSDANLTREQISIPLVTHTMAIVQRICAKNSELSVEVIRRVASDAGRDFSQMALLDLFPEQLKKFGYPENPLGPLSSIWQRGVWPIGRVKKTGWFNFDWEEKEEFVIFSPL